MFLLIQVNSQYLDSISIQSVTRRQVSLKVPSAEPPVTLWIPARNYTIEGYDGMIVSSKTIIIKQLSTFITCNLVQILLRKVFVTLSAMFRLSFNTEIVD
jgi:hypothetical protein